MHRNKKKPTILATFSPKTRAAFFALEEDFARNLREIEAKVMHAETFLKGICAKYGFDPLQPVAFKKE